MKPLVGAGNWLAAGGGRPWPVRAVASTESSDERGTPHICLCRLFQSSTWQSLQCGVSVHRSAANYKTRATEYEEVGRTFHST